MGGKSSGKNALRNFYNFHIILYSYYMKIIFYNLHNLPEKSAKYLTYAHSFHWPDPWHKED